MLFVVDAQVGVKGDIIAVTPSPMATATIMICAVRAACGRDSLSASLDVIISRKKKMTRKRITPPAPATSPTTLRVVASMGRACTRQPTDRQDTTTWHTPTGMSREGRRRPFKPARTTGKPKSTAAPVRCCETQRAVGNA